MTKSFFARPAAAVLALSMMMIGFASSEAADGQNEVSVSKPFDATFVHSVPSWVRRQLYNHHHDSCYAPDECVYGNNERCYRGRGACNCECSCTVCYGSGSSCYCECKDAETCATIFKYVGIGIGVMVFFCVFAGIER